MTFCYYFNPNYDIFKIDFFVVNCCMMSKLQIFGHSCIFVRFCSQNPTALTMA